MINELDSKIVKLYKIGSKLSHGAYGVVWKATNKETKDIVLLKKIHRAFGNPVDARRTYREVMMLREFNDHSNIVKLLHIYKAANNMDFYLIFEYMEGDLELLIGHGILRENEKRLIMFQIIKAVLYIHSGNVIHRDIKPSSILIDTRFRVKIADFGIARALNCNKECEDGCNPPPLTDYVVSCWYRAPELLLGSKRYTRGVDMWSLGCVLGEMLIDKPLFPGTSTFNQMELLLATIKPPSSEEIERFFPNYEGLFLHLAKKGCPLKEMLKRAPSDGVDLVTRLLVINPCRRLICEEALYHSYVNTHEENKSVPLLSYDVHPFVPDDIQLTADGYRRLLYKLVEDEDVE
ncbi:mitogen-activated protein kinase 15 [Anabrus simplex]|uniref:mitogen-activated protein kinase 15 n=1 Tax=Anabrus simplex TaxID=316456 RepID=UPI0035A30812